MRFLITLIPLAALATGEIWIAFLTSEGPDSSFARNTLIAITCGPLVVICFAAIFRHDLGFPKVLAWICITIGFCIQYLFHTSHDPSRILLLPISIITYWICGFLALICLGWGTPLLTMNRDDQ